MALTSPGVEVTIIDQSQYLPAPTGTVPLVIFATAQNKANPTGTGVAQGTTAANANKLFQVTSQRDLVTLYGTPFFYTTTNGTPIQGYELNEYGLLAAYSVLGVTNRIFALRADIDLGSLVGQTGRPTGDAENGTYWFDVLNSTFGIFEWNATTQKFTNKQPIVLTDSTFVVGDFPSQAIGAIGDYAQLTFPIVEAFSHDSEKDLFYKNKDNEWIVVGTSEWQMSWPTITSTISNPTLINGDFEITLSGSSTATITVSSTDTVYDIAGQINSLGWTWLNADVENGKLNIYSGQKTYDFNPIYVSISSTTLGLLTALGIPAGTYYVPDFVYGTSAQMPLWQSTGDTPRPNGSVWLKINAAGNGLNFNFSRYNSASGTWVSQPVLNFPTTPIALASLDPTGGKNIPLGTLVNIYNAALATEYPPFISSINTYTFVRTATGPTIVVGTVTEPVISSGILTVRVSLPNNDLPSQQYYVVIDSPDATDFVTAWSATNIPYTQASITTDGAISLTHTLGGDIYVTDVSLPTMFTGSINGTTLTVTEVMQGIISQSEILFSPILPSPLSITAQLTGIPGGVGSYQLDGSTVRSEVPMYQIPANMGESTGILNDIGMIPISTPHCTSVYENILQNLLVPDASSGSGTGLELTLRWQAGYINYEGVSNPGVGYVIGDTVTFYGTNFNGTNPANNVVFRITDVNGAGGVIGLTWISGYVPYTNVLGIMNFEILDYIANEGAPVSVPANNTNWFYSVVDQVDIMVNTSTGWKGYKNVEYDENGFPTPGSTFNTDPNGPIISATEPTTQSDGTTLVYGDIWIDTSDLELYPLINRWQSVEDVDRWVLIDNTDQITSSGVVFADARWATNGNTNPANDPIPTIKSLLTSNYLDLDAPDANIYPVGMLLFNTRRSGYNVKQFKVNYFNSVSFPDESLPAEKDAWVTASGLQFNGAPYMGRKAQRNMVVQALREAIDTNTDIRDEDNQLNLIATPNYPELQQNMVLLNNDRGNTGYILGDTPLGLPDDATAIQAWATNAAGAVTTGEDGCVTRDTYLGLFYPSGLASDLSGNLVVVPPSHMMLRTFVRNDAIAYPWFAAAGVRRGTIDNATNIGYLNRNTGEFVTTKTRIGIRDVLYTNFINPLVFFTGNGLLNYGNKTSFNSQSALDRTNVARLIAFIRRQLTIAARPFVFEQNDSLTRKQIQGVVQSLMIDLVAKRGIYDYIVICDESNNTPARIDRNELWVDVAIEPVKAAEFIYIPVRVLNTGAVSAV
jgi:hypothetical protein